MSSFPRVITTQSCNRVTPLVGAGVVAVSVGAIWLSVGAWRTGRAQRALRILWEGDQEGQRRTWGLKNMRRAREYVDELEEKIADAETEARDMVETRHREQDQVAGATASTITTNDRRNRLAKKLSLLSNDIDEAFKFLDGIQGDQVVREARKDQASRLETLGDRVDLATKLLST